jgi:hypothetical protein
VFNSRVHERMIRMPANPIISTGRVYSFLWASHRNEWRPEHVRQVSTTLFYRPKNTLVNKVESRLDNLQYRRILVGCEHTAARSEREAVYIPKSEFRRIEKSEKGKNKITTFQGRFHQQNMSHFFHYARARCTLSDWRDKVKNKTRAGLNEV